MAYYIGFILRGSIGSQIRDLIDDIDRDCRLTNINAKKPNPHITLVTPFETKKEKRIVNDFYEVCSNFSIIDFKLGPFGDFKKNSVVYIEIIPSMNLNNFRLALVNKFSRYCDLDYVNYNEIYYFHITLAKRLKNYELKRIKKYLLHIPQFNGIFHILKVAIIKNGKVFCEYDFLSKKMYFRE